MDRNKSRLTCPTCNDVFKNPRTLSCGHTFCSRCISNSPEYHDEMDVCTICDRHTSPEHLECAPYVRHLLKVFKTLKQAADGPRCPSCTSEVISTSHCVDCDEFYCQGCLKIHNKIPSTCKHTTCSLKELLTKDQFAVKEAEVINCSSHVLPIELYCITCEQSMCKACTGHDFHDVEDIKASFQHLVNQAEQVKELTEANIIKVDKALSEIEEVEHFLEKNKKTCLDSLADIEPILLSEVNQVIQSIKNQLEAEYESKVSQADTQVMHLSKSGKNLTKSLEIMDHLTEVDNPALVMDACAKIVRTLQSENDKANSLEPVINQHMRVSLADDNLIDNLQIVPDIVCLNDSIARKCKLYAVTSDIITCGRMSKFYLQTNDIDGNAVTIGGADVRAIFKHHTGKQVEADVLDRNDGSYDIIASCNDNGKYSVKVYVFNLQIPDVPEITVVRWVTPKNDYVVSKGEQFYINLQATDDCGIIFPNVQDNFIADLISPTDDIINLNVLRGDGSYEVKTTLLGEPGHWKISFRNEIENITCVDIYMLDWCFDITDTIKQLEQCFQITVVATTASPLRDPENEPAMDIALENPDGHANTLRAVKIDKRTYRLTLKCDSLGEWLVRASVFNWPLQRVHINIIEWTVDALSSLTCGEDFDFRVQASDVHGNIVHTNTALKSQVMSPTGQVVDLQVKPLDWGVFVIKGNFNIVGLWSLKVIADEMVISPIHSINVFKWKLDDDYIVLTRGEPFQRQLIAIDSNGETVGEAKGNFTAVLNSNSFEDNKVDVMNTSKGFYYVKGKCFEVGIWKLQIMINADTIIAALDIHVIDWAVDKGLIKLSVGQTFKTIVSAINAEGHKIVVEKQDVCGILRNPKDQQRKSETVKLDDGSYLVTGVCNVAGLWTLDIAVNGYIIRDIEVLIDAVKEEAIKHIETKSLWGNNNPGNLTGLASYSCGSVLLCNNSNEILQITTTGTFLTRIFLQDEQRQISCICSCKDGRIVLLDKAKREILVLPRFGQGISSTFGSTELILPFSVTVDENTNHIFVVDHFKSCVFKYSFSGDLIKIIVSGKSAGELKQPTFAVINIDGNLLISDNDNCSIQIFDNDGEFIRSWKYTKSKGFMVMPRRLLIHQDGKMVITGDHDLQLLDENGSHMKTIHENINRLMNPHGIALTSEMPRQVAFFGLGSSKLLVKHY
ncbi:uncharacterized protein LOC117101685 [Anneissia japonica]|uniref:uncharacterized protein LOC117101685 n=1 Tax=Anneissia japonica TaxID=1529436 RepID=UPI001425A2F3|nr:uncharacterized protein LOC117101685 [Anneissia japonica]